jgi:competence protein ComEC
VLRVSVGRHNILLTGDIESPVEKLLVHTAVLKRTDMVLANDCRNQLTQRPVKAAALQPSLAVVSAGFGNRWGMPRTEVVRRWEQAGASVLNTATAGAINQRICRSGGAGPVRRSRVDSLKYWHDNVR